MNTLGSRIKHYREAVRGMTQEELADCANCSQATIVKLESGKSQRSKYLSEIAKCLDVDTSWLMDGGELSNDSLVRVPTPDYKTEVPVISWVQAGETHVAFIENAGQYDKAVKTKRKHSKMTYALEVRGSSMTAPQGAKYSFPEGYIIIVDPEQRGDMTDGIFVIAKKEGSDDVTFKQLKYDGTQPYLNPLNDSYEKIFTPFRILGKVIDFDPNLPELP
jgi:SOS-response transcriptional repressor LexA